MARRVYFAFHYQSDIWRVNQVRNSWVTKDREVAGYYDASLWEEAKKESDLAIKRMINSGLENTSVTCVLIGSETYKRRWVQYEIIKSFDKGNSLFGVYIHSLKNQEQEVSTKGSDPFDDLGITLSSNGKEGYVKIWKNSTWSVFNDYPIVSCNYKAEYGGKFYRMSQLGFKLYDWRSDDGNVNFNTWVEN
jgi:hypothetical protein